MASLPISNSCGKSFVTSTGSASASMSLTSVSPTTGKGVLPSLHTSRIAKVMTDIPVWDTLDIYFSAMSDLAAQVSSRQWTCSSAISSYIKNGDSTAPSGPLKPGLIQRNICVMAYPIAACRLAVQLFMTYRQFFVGSVVGVQVQTVSLSDQLLASSGGCIQCRTSPRRSPSVVSCAKNRTLWFVVPICWCVATIQTNMFTQSWLTGYSHQPCCTSFSWLIRVSSREFVHTEKA